MRLCRYAAGSRRCAGCSDDDDADDDDDEGNENGSATVMMMMVMVSAGWGDMMVVQDTVRTAYIGMPNCCATASVVGRVRWPALKRGLVKSNCPTRARCTFHFPSYPYLSCGVYTRRMYEILPR